MVFRRRRRDLPPSLQILSGTAPTALIIPNAAGFAYLFHQILHIFFKRIYTNYIKATEQCQEMSGVFNYLCTS